jgi:hypothetical protein
VKADAMPMAPEIMPNGSVMSKEIMMQDTLEVEEKRWGFLTTTSAAASPH